MTSDGPLDQAQTAEPREPGRARKLRNYLIAGLLIWLPIMITVWVVRFLTGILDQSLVLIPPPWRPEALFGRYIPGLGVILSLLLLLVTGVLVKNLFGRQMVQGLENLVRRIPVVGPIYGGAKSFSETVLADKGSSFKQVVLVRFPYRGDLQHRVHHGGGARGGPGEDGRGRHLRGRAARRRTLPVASSCWCQSVN